MSTFIIEKDIDISPLLSAFAQFENAYKIAQSDLEKAGTIQYFEFTFELTWKTFKRILKFRGKDLNSPRPVFREAALEKLIIDPEVWFSFLIDRNNTVHTYNKSTADEIYNHLGLFYKEMKTVMITLKKLKV